MEIYTIGHSNHTWQVFSALLNENRIELLIDVRSRPYSRWAAFANKTRLPELLASEKIDYVFMGNSLGGRPEEPAFYGTDGLPDYGSIERSKRFEQSVKQLIELASNSKTAIMCSEEDPSKCHRHLLIEPNLIEAGAGVFHIRRDGSALTSDKLGTARLRKAVIQGGFPMPQDGGSG